MKHMLIALSLVLATPAVAKPPLGQVAEIRDGLIATGIAYEISKVCDGISARKLRGISYLMQLKSKARDMGYSNAEIDAFVGDSGEKARLEAQARNILARMGAVVGRAETYCAVGRAEIAKDSAIGRLLR